MSSAALRVSCPQCQATLKVVVAAPGERQTCPRCGAAFVPPAPAPASAPRDPNDWDELFDAAPANAAPPTSSANPAARPSPAPPASAAPVPRSPAPASPASPIATPAPAPAGSPSPAARDELPALPFDDDEPPAATSDAFRAAARAATSVPGDGDDDGEFRLSAPVPLPPLEAATPAVPPAPPAPVAELAGRFTFGVDCPVCGTRIECLSTDVGRVTRCPDCHTNFPIPAPREHQTRTPVGASRPAAGKEDEFRPMAPPPGQPAVDENAAQRKVAAEWLDQARREQETLDAAAEREFSGKRAGDLFVFLIQPTSLGRFAVVAGLAWLAVALDRTVAPLFGREWTNFLLVFLLVLAIPATAGWVIAAGAHAMSIFQSTTLRHRDVTWPEWSVTEWLGPGLYVVLAAVYSAIPGAVLGKLIIWADEPWMYLVLFTVVSWVAFFPPVFTSMANEASLFGVVSPAVLRSLTSAHRTWLFFYEVSALLGLIVWCVLAFAFADGMLVAPLVAFLTTLLGAVYFRLLGWTVGELSDVLNPDESEEEKPPPPASGGT